VIKALSCNRVSFRNITFTPDINVILADRTKEETIKNSRNGLGKSTFIEILHFCLGAELKGPLKADALRDWIFTLELTIAGKDVRVSRDTGSAGKVTLDGDFSDWPIQPKTNKDTGRPELLLKEWVELLGNLFFGLEVGTTGKYRPQFRSLISYFIRRGKDAYSQPFEFFRKQPAVSKQVLNTFLLGLSNEDAADFQRLKDRALALLQLKKLTTETGTAKEFLGSLGELEALKVRLEGQTKKENEELRSFRVHPQYEEISKQANQLTETIHKLTNENVVDKRLLELYHQSLKEEKVPESTEVVKLYERAGVELPGAVKKQLADVQAFHSTLVENRRSFLSSEVQRLEYAQSVRISQIETATAQRAELMAILQTHGALDEYTQLQQRYLKTRAELEGVMRRIKNIEDLQEGEGSLKIDRALLVKRARRGLAERAANRDRAIELFNANSQALYEEPGNLVVNVGDAGFEFDVSIHRSTSGGVENMKIFCYDLMLAQLWSERQQSPGVLVHDSIIFDGVDERQRALALQLAAEASKAFGFQYICTMNSDAVPWTEFGTQFEFNDHVRLRLSDEDEKSSLTGIRFEVDVKEEESEELIEAEA
jgi:uncharacterized protein YydD (DUF2326 family)